MPMVNVKSDMDRILNEVNAERNQLPKAAAIALNKTAQSYQSSASRAIESRYPQLKNKSLPAFFRLVQQANENNLTAVVSVQGKALSLMRFLVAQDTKQGAGGVYVSVKNGTRFIPHAFVKTLKKNNRDEYQVIFIRVAKGSSAVKVLKTINIPNALNIAEVADALGSEIDKQFTAEFERQLLIK